MDFLKESEIGEEVIIQIRKNNEASVLFDLEANAENIKEVIAYLKEIGIQVIEDLLLTQIDIFLHTKEELEKLFHPYYMPLLVSQVNHDSANFPLF